MMNQSFKTAAFVLFFALSVLLQSCSESDDPSMAQTKVSMKGATSQSTMSSSGRVAATGLIFHEVLLGVRELEFKTAEEVELEVEVEINGEVSLGDDDSSDESDDDNEGNEHEIEFEGQFVVDLIQGTSNPDFGIADIVPGLYKEIEVKSGAFLENGNSIFVAFEYTPAGASSPVMVEYSSKSEVEIEIEQAAGFQFSGGDLKNVLVLFNLDSLFAGINLDGATADSDGVIRINSSSNASIAAEIASNLHECGKAGEDDDDNDKIDDEEEGDDD